MRKVKEGKRRVRLRIEARRHLHRLSRMSCRRLRSPSRRTDPDVLDKAGYRHTKAIFKGRGHETFVAPANLSLSANFEETVRFLRKLRDWSSAGNRRPAYIDFKQITNVGPGAALALASELDRWNRLHPERKMKALDAALWNPSVRELLRQMGFFSLLGIDPSKLPKPDGETSSFEHRFLPFLAGEDSGGKFASDLRAKIEDLAGRLRGRYALYDGLVEAMTNVAHHAYPDAGRLRRWWISASVDPKKKRLTVVCLDHGVGIPATLPRSHSECARDALIKMISWGASKPDAALINAALELNRSRTKQRNRGYGLARDIKRYVEKHDSEGALRIISNHGWLRFVKNRSGKELVELGNHDIRFAGTLIEWTVEDYSEELPL